MMKEGEIKNEFRLTGTVLFCECFTNSSYRTKVAENETFWVKTEHKKYCAFVE